MIVVVDGRPPKSLESMIQPGHLLGTLSMTQLTAEVWTMPIAIDYEGYVQTQPRWNDSSGRTDLRLVHLSAGPQYTINEV